jgi:Mrp family chromosome partitioning ATPase/capsular polysaccharide biosynthesis protein
MAARPTPHTRPDRAFETEVGGTLSPLPVRPDLRHQWAEPSTGGPSKPGGERDGALGTYLRAIRSHLVLVVAIMVAAGVGAIAWGQLRTPSYEASAQVLVNPLPSDDSSFLGLPFVRETGDPPRTLQTAATLIDSVGAARLTARRLGAGWTVVRVQNAVVVSPQGQSSIVDVTATADAADRAARIANTYVHSVLDSRRATLRPLIDRAVATTRAQLSRLPVGSPSAAALADRVRQLENVRGNDPTLSISQEASAPQTASGIGLPLVLVLALIGGAVLGMVAALAIDLLRPRRLADEEELLSLYRLPVLSRIPVLPRRLRKQTRDSPLAIPPMVREGFRTLQVQLELQPGRHRSILVTSASSADGKTTSAVNFALELVGAGQKVVLMDLDLRKPDVGRVLELSPRLRLAELLDPGTRLESALVDMPGVPGLRVLPIDQGDGFQVLERLGARLPDMINEALATADYVIMDTAPLGEVSDALKMTTGVDDVLVVARLGNTRRANLELMRDLLERTRHTPSGLVVIGTSPRVVSSYYYYGYGAKSPVATG